jgi:hypothetical protein
MTPAKRQRRRRDRLRQQVFRVLVTDASPLETVHAAADQGRLAQLWDECAMTALSALLLMENILYEQGRETGPLETLRKRVERIHADDSGIAR